MAEIAIKLKDDIVYIEFDTLLKFGNIIERYKKWLRENDLKDKTESLLAFLYTEGYLKEKT